MSNTSGSILSLTIKGRGFSVAAGCDAKLSLGGRVNSLERNGDGKTSRLLWTMSNWSLTGIELAIDHDRGDLEFLGSLRDTNDGYRREYNLLEDDGTISHIESVSIVGRVKNGIEIELADGTIYTGAGIPVGRIEVSTMSGSAILDFEGDGELKSS